MKCLSKRKSKRLEVKNGIALTPKGVCQVINISKGGLSLKCFQELKFPEKLTIDIYSETDLNIEALKVKKVWAKKTSNPASPFQSYIEIGWSFNNLTFFQETQFDSYLLQLIGVEKTI